MMLPAHSEEFECTFSDGFAHATHMMEEVYIENCHWCQNEKIAEEEFEKMKTPQNRAEVRQWFLKQLQEIKTDGHGNMIVDINLWNNLWLYADQVLSPPAVKKEQPNTLDINRLGRAIHNLRWCKAAEIMHDLAHNIEYDNDEVLTIENSRRRLKEAYERAEEEEKILYGGNA